MSPDMVRSKLARVYALALCLLLFFCPCSPFSVTGIAPKTNGVTVWMDTSGADKNLHINYTVTELFPAGPTPASLSGTHNDLRPSFDILNLKPDTWYGLHMSIQYSWKGSQHSEPAHDVAFKTLQDSVDNSTNNVTDGSASTPVTIAARPISGGFQLRVMNQLGDRLRSPMEAYVTSACAGKNLGGHYKFTSDQPLQQTKDFLLNDTQLPADISNDSPSEWAVDACQSVCWSLFVSAAGVTYVLDSQCANLTEVFINTGSDFALWGEGEDGEGEAKDDMHDSKNSNSSSIQKRSGATSHLRRESYTWLMAVITAIFVVINS